MFKDKLGDTMEVYIDDMVVKSKKAEDHILDLEETLRILDEYDMNRFISRSSEKCKPFYDILKKNKRFE